MTTYNEFVRTNTFKVKNKNAFINALEQYEIKAFINIVEDKDDPNAIALIMNEGTPHIDPDTVRENINGNPYTDFCDIIADHLSEDSICIVTCSWDEEKYACGGWARSFDHTGNGVMINTEDIYQKTREKLNLNHP